MKADLAMAIHFHQPVGNFDHVMERACDKCYLPFIELLDKYPDIRMSFHFTGCLLEWAETKRPELIAAVRRLAERGQVEVMTGGFYEPIFPAIPREDRIGQIRKLTDYVKNNFSFDPSGAWIAERVWEPGLPSDLHDAGVKYVMLDDTHFLYAGIDKMDTFGYYMTEDNGKAVAVFPTDKTLRYQIPFKKPTDCTDYIKWVVSEKEDPLLVYGDDGEKFGEWPGTHKWVFEEKWLEMFFDELSGNSDWLRTVKVGDCLGERLPEGNVYLPATSYEEMLEWALPADKQEYMENVLNDIRFLGKEDYYKPFIRGGFWRNFLTKYPESNKMNKKMVFLSRKLREAEERSGAVSEEARDDLFRGQCNCAYWHGEFGGLYLFHLRRAIYHHLIKCEVGIDRMLYGKKDFCGADAADIDADGNEEVLLYNRGLSLSVHPVPGGVVKELNSKKACQNLINTLSRKKEAYHRKILEKLGNSSGGQGQENGGVKTIHEGDKKVEKGIEENLAYDWYGRNCFIDHFVARGTSIDEFSRCEYNEEGDFVLGAYSFRVESPGKEAGVVLKRKGQVRGIPVSIEKSFFVGQSSSVLEVSYKIKNEGKEKLETVFGPELNFAMPEADSGRYSVCLKEGGKSRRVGAKASAKASRKFTISDLENACSLEVRFSQNLDIWYFPINTVSQSEKAYELNYQGSSILPHFSCSLSPGEVRELSVTVEIMAR
ncbi:MAG: DUF1926 domain-containing protein [Candidatus Omnitrophica bacterium]|nr:DUF1926 domain-containing protein [Candidatus Omnitrophota bacterium]